MGSNMGHKDQILRPNATIDGMGFSILQQILPCILDTKKIGLVHHYDINLTVRRHLRQLQAARKLGEVASVSGHASSTSAHHATVEIG